MLIVVIPLQSLIIGHSSLWISISFGISVIYDNFFDCKDAFLWVNNKIQIGIFVISDRNSDLNVVYSPLLFAIVEIEDAAA